MKRPIRWPAEAIWQAVAPQLPGFTVEVLPRIDSTNTELMRRARAGRGEPTLLVAEQQTAGRGRLGRDWHSGLEGVPADTGGDLPSLTFSLGMPLAPGSWSGLSLAVGVSVAENGPTTCGWRAAPASANWAAFWSRPPVSWRPRARTGARTAASSAMWWSA